MLNDKNNLKLNDKKISLCLYVCIYLCMAVFLYWFFSKAHPLIVFDTDDWGYISETRSILPTFSTYNPAKVFPELLMPLCGFVSAKMVFPLTGDYIGSMTVVFAGISTVFILMYVFVFNLFIKKTFKLSDFAAVVLSVIFLAFHFWIFRKAETNNLHMFKSGDVNGFVNYIIPSALNAVLVMILMVYDVSSKFIEKGKWIFKIIFVVTLYLAIFSNLFSSVILAVFAGAVILYDIIKLICKKLSSKEFIKDTYLHFFIILLWAVSAYFEYFGGRSTQLSKSITLKSIKEALFCFYLLCVEDIGFSFFFFSIFVVMAALVLLVKSKLKEENDRKYGFALYTAVISIAVSWMYIFVLCLKTHYFYMQRQDVLFAFVFYAFIAVIVSMTYICQKIKISWVKNVILTLAALIIIMDCNTPGITYAETNSGECSPHVCYEISTSIVQQVLEAEAKGLTETEVYVPYYSEENWPLSISQSGRIGNSLYKHGVTDTHIKVTLVGDEKLTEYYYPDK